ncbi:MAG: lysophospholipid acyltransferase family protein [Myxococcaceae bacterium]
MNAFLSLWTWFEIGLVAFLGWLLQLALAPLTWPFDRRRLVLGRTFRLVGVVASHLTPFWHFRVVGPTPRVAGRTVVVSNHESQADPFLISYLPWEMKWLGKASLFRIPVVGWMMWLAGDIPVHRGDKTSGKGAMATCARWLARGVPVMIFPEGTRSTEASLLPFKDGAFRLAIETGADILPIAVWGTRAALPKHSWRFQKAYASVTVGTPLSTRGMGLESLESLKSAARLQVEGLRDRLRSLAAAR